MNQISREEMVRKLRKAEAEYGLEHVLPFESMGAICQKLGQSGRGTKDELLARIRRQIQE